MSIWLYLFLIVLCISIFLIIKIWIMREEIKNIGKSLSNIINSDTNNLITVNTNDKSLCELANTLNKSLKNLRKLELEYKNGNGQLKTSITNISHDLRTPLTAIRGYLDLMDNENLTNNQKKHLKVIDNKVKDLTILTEQLFDFSKSLDLQKNIEKENICLNSLLEETLVSFYGMFMSYNILPSINICDEKVIVLANENIVKRIFENIISNAMKYSDGDFRVKMFDNGTIEFSNKAKELDSTSVEKIFDRYYTVQNVKKSTGIGLSIAKQLVDLCGGEIQAKYKENLLIITVKLF